LDAEHLVGPVAAAVVQVIAETTTSEQRRHMIAGVSEALIGIVGEPRCPGVWVSVEAIVHPTSGGPVVNP
jgi:hypothetical protein